MGRAIVWFRRDLRLADHPALRAALDADLAPIPVYIHAPEEEGEWAPGAASLAWLHRSLKSLDADLRDLGSRLIVRRGPTRETLGALIGTTGADAVFWNRLYEPAVIERDAAIKKSLRKLGLRADSFNAALLNEPWRVETRQGGPYKVFTPYWKTAKQSIDERAPDAAPTSLPSPPDLESLAIDDLGLAPDIAWDSGFWQRWRPGEGGAMEMLNAFIEGAAHGYKEQRDYPGRVGTSRLSPHLHFGEISPRQIVARLRREDWKASEERDIAHYLSELGWREFSHHLLHHFPKTPTDSLNERFDGFDWAKPDADKLKAWQRGGTGIPIVDAGMRELWTTGWLHNRVRMIVASVLTKNLRYHWRHGARWFWDTLVDADLANNTQGWQWAAGTGADAAPYFRIFNPVTQSEKFDPDGTYIRRWVPELEKLPDKALHAPWEHVDLARRCAPDYPVEPVVDLKVSREEALSAYRATK